MVLFVDRTQVTTTETPTDKTMAQITECISCLQVHHKHFSDY